ncbi:DNA starvation/stationary phase protection protein Dps [Altererythrobacter sp. SALINAS58]|uniref:DNA starvation/stationary phase protection protein Dps n=1 Tax=Alteripontixanthobacter muriae TaxID=2705546 RepID=UPI0015757807|nr:DNA starvation/stationary phase protection protein Dps [Alteripontixanthobacter muriae]NTZ42866.1 DNA starvation/stationary phase protection protein Dps [Alteripontixanthobacter muriae]
MEQIYVAGLDDKARENSIKLLNERLTDSIDLSLAVKQAHWTIRGPSFIGLHELLDAISERMRDRTDMIAERAIILGGHTPGTVQAVDKGSKLEPYPADIKFQKDHVEALTSRFVAFGKHLRESIEKAEDAGDVDTSDLFTEVSRGIDKDAWFLGAHYDEANAKTKS